MNLNDIAKLNPHDFEKLICSVLKDMGYKVKQVKLGDDIGIDIIANNEGESLAVQVKKYVNRKINLAMIYHTYGAATYYECSRSVIVTLSDLTPRAIEAAQKLKVEIWNPIELLKKVEYLHFEPPTDEIWDKNKEWFYHIWNTHIKSLQGTTIRHITRPTHITVITVNDDGMIISNSNGRIRRVDIEIFHQVLTKLKCEGKITRSAINNDYQRRGSSAICAILAIIPGIEKDDNAQQTTLVWKAIEENNNCTQGEVY